METFLSENVGNCSIYGSGGPIGYFGPKLPLVNHRKASKLTPEQYDKLINICGDSWRSVDYVCCDDDQMDALKTNLQRVDPIIASCPACRENFYQLFCHFSCSPQQAQFVNVTKSQLDMNGDKVVDVLDVFIDGTNYAEPFFDSCKNIKFGATNGYAMDLIGGGATNYKEFLKFLGDKKPEIGGSPFQINFKYNSSDSMDLLLVDPKSCNDEDPNFKCSCSDCPTICPELEDIHIPQSHAIGGIPSNSFYLLLAYILMISIYFSIGYYKRYQDKKSHLDSGFLVDDDDEFLTSHDNPEDDIDYHDLNDYASSNGGTYPINDKLELWFFKLGKYCALNVKLVLILGTLITFCLSLGMVFLNLETNPVNLWVSPKSDAYIQKQKFDESFGPFYRTQQIIISNSTGPVFQSYDFVKWWFEKESEILNLSIEVQSESESSTTQIKYEDICFKPLGESCILESFTQYFNGDISKISEDNWKSSIEHCANSPVECLPSFQQPLKRSLLFGGDLDKPVLDSGAIVITLLNNNNNDQNSDQIKFASKWEEELEQYLSTNLTMEVESRGLNLGFITEISLEKELNKSTNTDGRIVIISYLVMFAYASLALGNPIKLSNRKIQFNSPIGIINNHFNGFFKLFTHTRFGLGFIGILIVSLSVTSSVGFWSILGLKSTLIIAEVIPFLILAVGVDNIFLICNGVSQIENSINFTHDLSIPDKIGFAVSKFGSSITLSCSCQFLCFILGSVVEMPAVRNFALYSAMAILFNTILQLTVFLSILSLDMRRIELERLDIFPLIEIQVTQISSDSDYNHVNQIFDESPKDGIISSFFQKVYAKWLLSSKVSNFIFGLLITLTGISISMLPNIELGLDQRIALPEDSYLINYFDDIYEYLNVGPPIYFITEELDVTNRNIQKSLCSKFTGCDSFSLVNILTQESERSNISTIAEPPASWIDDFFLWLNPDLNDCCTIKRHSLGKDKEFCPPFSSPRVCQSCYENRTWGYNMDGFPVGDEFLEFVLAWLDQDSYACPLAGKAPYGHQIDFLKKKVPGGDEILNVKRSSFRTSHTPLRSQKDFINAYENSQRVINEVKDHHKGLNIWAYSPFYIFFVQYGTLIQLTLTLIGIGLVLIFGISTLLLGSWRNSLIFICYLITVLISIGSWMSIQSIGLNAVSLVNLLICLGLSVEFGIHLVREFNFSSSTVAIQLDDEPIVNEIKSQAINSLIQVGPSTLSGITLTKILGISVLSFTHSQIFRVYYFKMWVGLIFSASIGALVFLPVLLSKFGDKSWNVKH